MDAPQIETFDTWGIVEIMGHSRFAGHLMNASIGGASMLRIDVPETKESQPFTKYFGGSAIFSITPTDEATARAAAASFRNGPPIPYEMQRAALPAPARDVADEFDDVEDEIDYRDRI